MTSAAGKHPQIKCTDAIASLGQRLVSLGLATSTSEKDDKPTVVANNP